MRVARKLGEFYNKDKGARFVLKYAAQFPEGAINAIEFEKMVEIFDQFGNETKRVYDFVIDGKKYELKAWTKWAPWSDEAFLNQFVKDITSIDNLKNLQWVFMKTEDITEENLYKYIIQALKNEAKSEKLLKIEVSQVIKLTGIENIDDANKVNHIVQYLSNKNNFRKIFNVAE